MTNKRLNTYFLSLGSNLGEREHTLRQALCLIEQQIGPVRCCSSFYYSEPWGFESVHAFCNLCCAVDSPKAPIEMLQATQAIEQALGRTHKSVNGHYSDRTIDIDLIQAFDEQGQEIEVHTPELTLPHPLWLQRDFVRIPLEEIKNSRFCASCFVE